MVMARLIKAPLICNNSANPYLPIQLLLLVQIGWILLIAIAARL